MDQATFIAQLVGLVNAYTSGGPAPTDTPPDGFVAVRPTGPEGAGKVRFWPKPYRVDGQRPQDGEMSMAYAQRCARTPDPLNPGKMMMPLGDWLEVPGFDPYQSVNGLAEMADRDQHWRDWASQAELAAEDAATARDAASNSRFSGGLLG